jgi:hypothetical protein
MSNIKVTSKNIRPPGFEFPAGLNSKLVVSDTRVNVGLQLATAAPSGLTNPTSPEGQQTFFGDAAPGPGQKVRHTFRQSGSFTCGFTGNVDVIVVGAGGAGGGGYGGGGGGGGVVFAKSVTVQSGQTYPVIVGAGGTNPAHNPPQRGGNGANSEIQFYDGAHPMCNNTGYIVGYGGGGGGAVDRASTNGNPGVPSGEGNAPGSSSIGSGGGGAGTGNNYNEENLGAIGVQDPNHTGYYPVDGGQLSTKGTQPTITAAAIANNPATSPVSGPPTNPSGNATSYHPFYPYPGMSPSMPANQYVSGAAYPAGAANNHFGMPGGQGTYTAVLRDSNKPSSYGGGAGPVLIGGGGGGAAGQGFGVGWNPTSSGTGTPVYGSGGDAVTITSKGVVPIGSIGAGGGGGTNGPPRGGGSGGGSGASNGRNPFSVPAPLAPSFPGRDQYIVAESGTVNGGGGGGGGGAPGSYNPYFPGETPSGPTNPGSGGSGVVHIVYDAVTGDLSNGAVYFIN